MTYLHPTMTSGLHSHEPGSPQAEKALAKVGRQLEAVFVRMMFEEMAKGLGDNPLFPKAPGGDLYQEWFRGQIAESFAEEGGFGLGDVFSRQVSGRAPSGGFGRDTLAPAARDMEQLRGRVEPRVTSGFGWRQHPVTGTHSHHRGIDLAAKPGTPVRSPFPGRVVSVSEGPHLGLHVVVDHDEGFRSLYAHLSRALVKPGDSVTAASMVGQSGSSGRATGPHLHFGLYKDGEAIDPTGRVQFSSVLDGGPIRR